MDLNLFVRNDALLIWSSPQIFEIRIRKISVASMWVLQYIELRLVHFVIDFKHNAWKKHHKC